MKGDNLSLKSSNSELNEKMHRKETEINSEKKIRIIEEIVTHHSSVNLNNQPVSEAASFDILSEMMREKEVTIGLRVPSQPFSWPTSRS